MVIPYAAPLHLREGGMEVLRRYHAAPAQRPAAGRSRHAADDLYPGQLRFHPAPAGRDVLHLPHRGGKRLLPMSANERMAALMKAPITDYPVNGEYLRFLSSLARAGGLPPPAVQRSGLCGRGGLRWMRPCCTSCFSPGAHRRCRGYHGGGGEHAARPLGGPGDNPAAKAPLMQRGISWFIPIKPASCWCTACYMRRKAGTTARGTTPSGWKTWPRRRSPARSSRRTEVPCPPVRPGC